MELNSLKDCDFRNNSIASYNLLNEVLKDARAIALRNAESPLEVSRRIKADSARLSERCKLAREKSMNAIERLKRSY